MSNANEPDTVNTGALATTIGIVAFSTLGIALYVTSLVREETRVLGDARQGTQDRVVRELRADQLDVLEATPTWKDRAAGVVTLPIDRAMEWMVEAVRKNPTALSPWHPPPKEAMGGAGPDEEPLGTGGTSAGSDGAEGALPEGAGPEVTGPGAAESAPRLGAPPAQTGSNPPAPADTKPAPASPAAAPAGAPTGAP